MMDISLTGLDKGLKGTVVNWIYHSDNLESLLVLRPQPCAGHSPVPDTALYRTQPCTGHSPVPDTALYQT